MKARLSRPTRTRKAEARRSALRPYSYGGDSKSGAPMPRSQACYSCHDEHAPDDTVFTQFYPSLTELRDTRAKATTDGQ